MNKYHYTTPLLNNRADPWIYKHTDGFYYFTASAPEFDRIDILRADSIEGLREAEFHTIWSKHIDGEMSKLIWAPEIHYLNDKWYIYFAATHTEEFHLEHQTFQHRMYVLENRSSNPLEGEWVEKGQVRTEWESLSLDATVFEHNGKLYYIWAQKDPMIKGYTNLYIAEMENPYTLKFPQVMLTKPEYPWEIKGVLVNEGPAVLKRNGKIFITYSASAIDENYCMGLLVADENTDLLDVKSWTKSREPVFQSSPENEKYGTGHNSFTKTEDDRHDILVYHARDFKSEDSTLRHACVQIFDFDENGTPDFGKPIKNTF